MLEQTLNKQPWLALIGLGFGAKESKGMNGWGGWERGDIGGVRREEEGWKEPWDSWKSISPSRGNRKKTSWCVLESVSRRKVGESAMGGELRRRRGQAAGGLSATGRTLDFLLGITQRHCQFLSRTVTCPDPTLSLLCGE